MFCLFLTSINYWRKPTLSLRRNVDIFFAIVSFMYHKYNMLNDIYKYIIPITLMWFGIIFYLTGIFLSKNRIYLSVICHMLLHVFTNVSCLIYLFFQT